MNTAPRDAYTYTLRNFHLKLGYQSFKSIDTIIEYSLSHRMQVNSVKT